MREVEEREIRSYKCPMCGCRNKLVYDICRVDGTNKIGYTYRCCNCGTETKSTNPDMNIPAIPKNQIILANKRCFQFSACRNYNCEFNTRTDRPDNYPEDITGSSGNICGGVCKCIDKDSSPIELTFKAARLHECEDISCDKFR